MLAGDHDLVVVSVGIRGQWGVVSWGSNDSWGVVSAIGTIGGNWGDGLNDWGSV
jgi:hypothetical protein